MSGVRIAAKVMGRCVVPSLPVPTLRSALGALLTIAASVAAAAGVAFVVDRGAGLSAPYPPIAAALVVAAVFWWRPPEGLLAFGMFALLAGTIEHWLDLDLLLFDEVGLLLLVAAAIGGRHAELGRFRLGWLETSLAVLVAVAILSSVANAVPIVTWVAGLFLLLKGIGFFYLVRLLRLRPADAERMGLVVLVVAGAICALGFVEWFDPAAFQGALGLPVRVEARGEVTVIRSIFLHPALFGWLTAFASLLGYARFATHRSWWALPLAMALNVGTFISGRRTPLLGVAAALGVGLLWHSARIGIRRAAFRIWLPAGAALVALAVITAPLVGRLATITASEYGPSLELAGEIFADDPRPEVVEDVQPRVALYAASLAIARDHLPLGGGVGRFGSHLSREDYSPLYERYGLDQVALLGPQSAQATTDAFWPMVLGETGVIGLVAGLFFFAGIGVLLWRAVSTAASARLRMIVLAALFVFIEALVRSATSSVFVAPPIAYFALGAAGIALSAAASDGGASDGKPPGRG